VLYCHLWPVRIHNIFPRYLTNGTIFEEEEEEEEEEKKKKKKKKRVTQSKRCVLIFSTTFI
jgi:hypothetical protein